MVPQRLCAGTFQFTRNLAISRADGSVHGEIAAGFGRLESQASDDTAAAFFLHYPPAGQPQELEVDGRRFRVISLDDLIAANEAMGREKDLLTAKELRAIAAKRREMNRG